MIDVTVIFIITCIFLISSILLKPILKTKYFTINTFWLSPLFGAVLMILTNNVSIKDIVISFTSDTTVNPLKILILFISMTLISVFLDCVGFFRFLASIVLEKAGKSQLLLFFYLYITVSLLTIFTSNDIVILTFTPFICYFAKNAEIDPVPYLITEFIAANTWSMLLIIGNPTNIYLATNAELSFASYIFKMFLPTVSAGIVSLIMLYLIFRTKFSEPIKASEIKKEIKDKPAVIIGLIHLIGSLFFMVISSYIKLPMWMISLGFCVSLFTTSSFYYIIRKKGFSTLIETIKRTPVETIPFILSMFVIVLALQNSGITEIIATTFSKGNSIFTFGISSFLTANLINNIPMSVLYSSIINKMSTISYSALYSTIIGSNLGAFFTPFGALAGIMWTSLLKDHNVSMTFFKFIKYGSIISIPVLFSSLSVLYLVVN